MLRYHFSLMLSLSLQITRIDLHHKLQLLIQTVYSCYVMYAFQSESTLYSCLNVKELLAQSRHEIWRLSGFTWARTENHLVLKRTLNNLAKWLNVRLGTKWFWVRVQLQLLIHNIFFILLLLSSVISKVFVADFDHELLCWKRYSTKIIVVLILKYPAQQTNTYSNSATKNLKQNVKSVIALLYSQLVTCLRLCSSVFLVYHEHVFVYCDVFVFTIFFFSVFIVNFKQMSPLDLLLSVISFVWVQKKPPEVFFKKAVL